MALPQTKPVTSTVPGVKKPLSAVTFGGCCSVGSISTLATWVSVPACTQTTYLVGLSQHCVW